MRIDFYLDDLDDTEITSFYNMVSNPFKLGDEVSLNVGDLLSHHYIFPDGMKVTKDSFKKKIEKENDELKNMFRFKKIKLIKESKYMTFQKLGDTELIIEYKCEFAK